MPHNSVASHVPASSSQPPQIPAAVLVGAATFALLLANGNALLNDPDTQWHVAVGQWIWGMQAVPRIDVFSHTFAGEPWIAKEWLAQLILYAVQFSGGWLGVACLAALALAGTVALVCSWMLRSTSPTVAFGAAAVLVIVAAPHTLARPHLLVLPILAGWMIGLIEALRREIAPSWWFAALMALWANLHASYPLGLLAAGLLGAEAVMRAPCSARARSAMRWGGFLVLCFLAALATPYGLEPIFVTIRLFGKAESIGYIQEWRPLALDPAGILSLAILAATLSILIADWRRHMFRIVLTVLLGIMMIRHARFETSFVLVSLIMGTGPVLARFQSLRERSTEPLPRWGAPTTLAITLALAIAIGGATLQPFMPNPLKSPVAALVAARAAGLSGRVYNAYDFGGFLIAQGVKTFIDGRTDQLFIGGFMKKLEDALEDANHRRFTSILDHHGVEWALVEPASSDERHLAAMNGWSCVHRDDIAVVFRRDQG